ncbi:MAG: hypothetical protein ACU837_15870 [Gammaproteobacteria bacterium]
MKNLTRGILFLAAANMTAIGFAAEPQGYCGGHKVTGSYIQKELTQVTDVDTGESFRVSRLITFHEDGTYSSVSSGWLEKIASVGVATQPEMGNWVCRDAIVYGVAFDFFSAGEAIGGHPLESSTFDEFDRRTLKLNMETLKLQSRLIGIAKARDQYKLNPNVKATVVSSITEVQLVRIANIKKIVDADFAR